MVNSLLQPLMQQLSPLAQQAWPHISKFLSAHKGQIAYFTHAGLQHVKSHMTQEQRDQLDACVLWVFKQYAFYAVSTTVGVPSPLLSLAYNKVEELFKGKPELILAGKEHVKEELERLVLKERLKKEVNRYLFDLSTSAGPTSLGPSSAGPTSEGPTFNTLNGTRKPVGHPLISSRMQRTSLKP